MSAPYCYTDWILWVKTEIKGDGDVTVENDKDPMDRKRDKWSSAGDNGRDKRIDEDSERKMTWVFLVM